MDRRNRSGANPVAIMVTVMILVMLTVICVFSLVLTERDSLVETTTIIPSDKSKLENLKKLNFRTDMVNILLRF